MADMAIEAMEHEEELRFSFRHGLISELEAYEAGLINELGYEIGPSLGARVVSKECKYCGQKGLHWETHKEKWRLFDKEGLHICPVNPLKEKAT